MLTAKREELYNYCEGKHCSDCPIAKDNPNHRCGNGGQFMTKRPDGSYDMADEEVLRAYAVVFGEDNPVTHPSHYTQGNIECIDAMVSAFGNEAVSHWCKCNAFKYIWREAHKNGMEDIDKAIWYLNKYKELCVNE